MHCGTIFFYTFPILFGKWKRKSDFVGGTQHRTEGSDLLFYTRNESAKQREESTKSKRGWNLYGNDKLELVSII